MPSLKSEFDINIDTSEPSRVRTGIASPFGPNKSGGLSLSSGEEHDAKIIRNALLGESSNNPFQQPQTSIEAALFDMEDPSSQAIVRVKLEQVFAEFEKQHRYRLLKETIVFAREEEGQMSCYFKYHNLESDAKNPMYIGPIMN